MSTLHIAWISISRGNGIDGNLADSIRTIVSAEALTTSSTSAPSTSVCPDLATHALVTSVDANHYVMWGSGTPVAAAANSVPVLSGTYQILPVPEGQKIAAMTF